MTKEELVQIFSDFSVQCGEVYEERCILDYDFDELAKVISEKYTRVIILSDDCGHECVLPYELKEDFDRLLNLGEDGEDEFNEKFEQYMCGGDCTHDYEFYIKK